jgi:hypothetical protein
MPKVLLKPVVNVAVPEVVACRFCFGPVKSGIAVSSGFCCGVHKSLFEFAGRVPAGPIAGQESGEEATGQGFEAPAPVSRGEASRGDIICRDCGVSFPKPVKRGRPPVRCLACKGNPQAPDKAVGGAEKACQGCGVALVPSGKRGRPATRCGACRVKQGTPVFKPAKKT